MIGNTDLVETLTIATMYDWHGPHDYGYDYDIYAFNGFKSIGAGCSRTVYVHESDPSIAYKVGDAWANRLEPAKFEMIRNLNLPKISAPMATLWELSDPADTEPITIVACEFIQDQKIRHDCMNQERWDRIANSSDKKTFQWYVDSGYKVCNDIDNCWLAMRRYVQETKVFKLPTADIHPGNVCLNNGIWYIIDAGE